ncbi:MAG: type II toxin-antitoxin system PemK/MazF family toxin [Microbacterium gubbeenense]|uniref:type II toxin-antitoxin system PemK/MazF family toxin n=1 Tax=Microbacterium gubbeenense TaxID=159896 RepID=UPI003F9974E3
MAKRGFWSTVLTLGVKALADSSGNKRNRSQRAGSTDTIEVSPEQVRGLLLEYSPNDDGDPDAGEIVWTWVPYAENDGRGKDRPVLVIARQSADRVYAVKLTSKQTTGRDDRLGIGSGPWDSSGRPSWVDTDQLYSVHRDGMRREAAALDLDRFTRVAMVLQKAYGWKTR